MYSLCIGRQANSSSAVIYYRTTHNYPQCHQSLFMKSLVPNISSNSLYPVVTHVATSNFTLSVVGYYMNLLKAVRVIIKLKMNEELLPSIIGLRYRILYTMVPTT